MRTGQYRFGSLFLVLACIFFTACSSRLGWGVLLWSTDEPFIPSGTVVPVYIRSNINKVWIIGVPKVWQAGREGPDKIEVPFSRLEMAGSRAKAQKLADSFARYALAYAENLQDGLPIRDNPDNNARRVYRLRTSEIVKILSLAEGVPAISASGDPLPGDWYRVLTEDGSTGYCFSYRLRLFDHHGGPLAAAGPLAQDDLADPELDILLSKTWSPESYLTMIDSQRINLWELSRKWRFDPGQDTGIARIYMSDFDLSFSYNNIQSDGGRAWRFEGTSLSMQLRSDTTLAVQFSEGSGSMKTLLFVSLPVKVDDIIMQENARRDGQYMTIYRQGPVFTSNNYGTIVFGADGRFEWRGYDLLVPQFIPETADGTGRVAMDFFLDRALEDRFNGAFTLRFAGSGGGTAAVLRCIYVLDNQGFRIELVPESSIEDVTVTSRAASPMVLYFFRDTTPVLPPPSNPLLD